MTTHDLIPPIIGSICFLAYCLALEKARRG
jgi:hypothetical protein